MKMKKICLAITLLAWSVSGYSQDYPPGACSLIPGSQTCVDATPCKTLTDNKKVCLQGVPLIPGALPINSVCWKYKYDYACDGPVPSNSCTPYENNSACSIIGSECTDTRTENGQCVSWNFTYKCLTQAQQTTTEIVCSGDLFNTSTLPTPSNPNGTFVKAALAMEIARQTQVYGNGGATTVFNGEQETCTKGYWGIRNCCTGTPGAQSNRSFVSTVTGSAAYSGVKYVGQQAVDYASPYVFDAMYSSGMFSDGLMASISSFGNVAVNEAGQAAATNFATNGFTMSAYGFTYGTGAYDAASALPGTMDLSGSLGMTDGFMSFNPYVFAAMLVLQYLQSLSQCDEAEMMFQMHKGANLTYFIKEECTNTVLGSCVEYTQTHCSFNSVLAKIINIQGKTQLGLDVSDCAGLTVDQVGQLDFTTIDMTEFTGQLLQEAQNGLPGNIKGNYTPVIQGTNQGTTQSTSTGTAYPGGPQIPPVPGAPHTPPPATPPVTTLPPLPPCPVVPPGTPLPPCTPLPPGTQLPPVTPPPGS